MLSDGTAVIEMASASGLALVQGRNDPLRATTRGTGELIAAAIRRAARARHRRLWRGSATTDGGLGGARRARLVARGLEVTVACDVTTAFVDAAVASTVRRRARPRRRWRCSRDGSRRLGRAYESRPASTSTSRRGARARPAVSPVGLAAIGAQLEPGFDVVAPRRGVRARTRRRASRRHRRRASSTPRASTGRSSAECSSGPPTRACAHAAVIAGQVTDEARGAVGPFGDVRCYALTDRVWQAGEAFARDRDPRRGSGGRSRAPRPGGAVAGFRSRSGCTPRCTPSHPESVDDPRYDSREQGVDRRRRSLRRSREFVTVALDTGLRRPPRGAGSLVDRVASRGSTARLRSWQARSDGASPTIAHSDRATTRGGSWSARIARWLRDAARGDR